ncbi:MAG: GNAT family N-acetyltransferase [Ignavibacteria bacterium]|nr:GNAT family N-acetyltransferase [Ignavibacteria bacterium]
MELSFVHFNSKENLSQQRELFKDCFPETDGETIQKTSHYLWKFHSFPDDVQSWEYACYFESEMVGYYAAISYRYKIGRKITPVGMVCDVMTSSKHQGKGIFTQMGKFSTKELSSEVPFTMGYPIRKEVIPGHLKVGWKIPFTLPLYIKFLRLNSLLASKKLGFTAPVANIFLSVYNFFKQTKYNRHYKSSIFTNINDIVGYESFAKEWADSLSNSLIKDLPFANWRYAAPERKYKFLSINDKSGKMIGFVSFRSILKEGVPSYGLIDYMVLPGCEDCHGLIIEVLTRSAKTEGVEAIMTMMSKKSAAGYLLCKNGFLKSPFVFSLIIKNLTNEFGEEELFDENKWHLMWVDSDDL